MQYYRVNRNVRGNPSQMERAIYAEMMGDWCARVAWQEKNDIVDSGAPWITAEKLDFEHYGSRLEDRLKLGGFVIQSIINHCLPKAFRRFPRWRMKNMLRY